MKHTARLLEIMAQLRDPAKGCPWDVEQNFASIVPYTLEEAYEVAEAIEQNDMNALKEELGDLLLQVVFHAQMAKEQGLFAFEDVANAINEKLVVRHPHVFGNADIKTAEDQLNAWETIKAQERAVKKGGARASALDDIPLALPALVRAVKLQKRAAKVGFDWPHVKCVFEKLEEEIAELRDASQNTSHAHIAEELGDLLFVVANLARHFKVDPEDALRATNKKFERRFHYIEETLAKQNRTPEDSTLEEMDRLWDEAKAKMKKVS